MNDAAASYLDDLTELQDHIAGQFGDDIVSSQIAYQELTVTVPCSRIIAVLTFLRDDTMCQFSQLIELAGVDYPERRKRFDVAYHLLSISNNMRIRVKIQVAENDAVPSVTEVFPNADWYEREAFDMYGVVFDGHPDMRRLLTDYGFEGHPLRKDFPLTGYTEVRWDDEQQRVVHEPVKLTQEYRDFDYLSPWEGSDYVLPGDEKADEKAS
ncbi:MAG: NADH-quinone oxidoreductase subunit C [Pseudomonadota bacterium]